MIADASVPTAAPAAPIFGAPNLPYINTKFKQKFTTNPTTEQISGAFTRSVDRSRKLISTANT